MSRITKSKLLLFGFIGVLLIGIPTSLYLLRQQQLTESQAEKATTLSFLPDSSSASPIQVAIDDPVALDINVNPGTNIVSFVKLEIQYDDTKLATAEADAFVVNDTAFPVTLEGPTYSQGKIAITLSVGSDPTKAIQTTTKAATVNFTAIGETGDTPTNVTYGNTTEILSIGSNDQASENVLLTVNPAVIAIGAGSSGTPTVAPTDPVATTEPTTAPQPTTPPPPTSIPPTTSAGTPIANQAPVCQSLNIDRDTTGGAPYPVTFTAVGNDTDGTISKVTFNYGDGPVETVSESGGIGSNAVSVQKAHTYNNTGTYQASVIITDNANGVSDVNTCKKTIVVLAPTTAGGTGGGGNTGYTPFPTGTIGDPGPGDAIIGIGALAAMLTLIGGLIFFAL
jgi:hypothetical protein